MVNISTTQTIKPEPRQRVRARPAEFPPVRRSRNSSRTSSTATSGGGGQPEALPRQRDLARLGLHHRSRGLVVTNNHVIADADEITVTLQDDTNLKAEVMGRDTKTDLALLRIKPTKPLPRSSSATATRPASATGCWRSATRSGSAAR